VRQYAPWYVIAWRLLWAIPLYVSMGLFLLFVTIVFGPDMTKKAWQDLT
jgi:Zn-dependent protease